MKNRDLSFLKDNLIVHRGLHNKDIPENSLKAFKEAIKKGYIIELDVHLLKDNSIVVFHDDNLLRMTGLDKDIKDCTFDELRVLKLGDSNERIPLFSEVLDLIDGKVPIIVELKYDLKVGKLENELVKLLDKYKGKYVVKCFRPSTVYWFKKNRPNVIRGQLSYNFKNKKMNIIVKKALENMIFNCITKPDFISYGIGSLPNRNVAKFRRYGLVLGWTIKDKKKLEKAKMYCDNYIVENIDDIL